MGVFAPEVPFSEVYVERSSDERDASEKQRAFLIKLGVRLEETDNLGIGQASRMIDNARAWREKNNLE
jgi:hypothetical protein